jgi:hypothetical protein
MPVSILICSFRFLYLPTAAGNVKLFDAMQATSNEDDGVMILEGASHRGEWPLPQRLSRAFQRHVLQRQLKPQAGLEPCTAETCTVELTDHGR